MKTSVKTGRKTTAASSTIQIPVTPQELAAFNLAAEYHGRTPSEYAREMMREWLRADSDGAHIDERNGVDVPNALRLRAAIIVALQEPGQKEKAMLRAAKRKTGVDIDTLVRECVRRHLN